MSTTTGNIQPKKSGSQRPWRFDEPTDGDETVKEPELIIIRSSGSEEEEDSNNAMHINTNYNQLNLKMEQNDDIPDDELTWAKPLGKVNQFSTNKGKPKPKRVRNRKRDRGELASVLKNPTKRVNFSFAQYEALNATWEVTQSPPITEVRELVHITGLTQDQVKNWFKNRRRLMKEKAAKGLLDYEYEEINEDDLMDQFEPSGFNIDIDPAKKQPQFNSGRRRVSDSSLNTTSNNSTSTSSNNHSSSNPVIHSMNPFSSDKSYNDAVSTNSSTSRSTSTNSSSAAKLSEMDKRNKRLIGVKYISGDMLTECMEDNKARLSQLILMYMKKKLDMKNTLLRETRKLNERIVLNPFSPVQVEVIKKWMDGFFEEIQEGLKEDKKQKLVLAKSDVMKVWQPIIVYGKLSRISLEAAIKDLFHLNGASEAVIAETDELTVPGILRYMETHF